MTQPPLPAGRYLSCAIDVHADNFGQTKALLMRNRIFAARTGIVPTILSFGASNDMDERRQVLLERGLLANGVELHSIYEAYADTDWPGDQPTGRELKDISGQLSKETALPDGTPWRRTYRYGDDRSVYDYLRPDGTTWLRIPQFVFREHDTWPTSLLRVARSGEVLGEYTDLGQWFRRWVTELAADHERTFAFCDSRFLAPFLAPLDDPAIQTVYLLHNIHLAEPHRWDSPTGEVLERMLGLVGDFDAFVTLTDRQREDIAERRGHRDNMFVVPNPVDLPAAPEVVERDPHQVSVMARLVTQKRLRHAVTAMRDVVRQVPEARLDIFGDGPRRQQLQEHVDRLGLGGSVTLRGHDPRARETLWRSSAFVMTSGYEGYPLSTLESMSHACPVVSYDIKYGPREQITDGVDGFLVPDGDVKALADRIVHLLRDPGLVAEMGAAARAKAEHHGYDRFMADWRRVLDGAVALKEGRTVLEDVQLDVTRLDIGRNRAVPGVFAGRKRLTFAGRLTVRGHSKTSRLSDAVVRLSAIHEQDSAVVDVPLEATPREDGFDLSASAPLGALYPADGSGHAHLRLRLVWHNSVWETVLPRTDGDAGGTTGPIEVTFDRTGELRLNR